MFHTFVNMLDSIMAHFSRFYFDAFAQAPRRFCFLASLTTGGLSWSCRAMTRRNQGGEVPIRRRASSLITLSAFPSTWTSYINPIKKINQRQRWCWGTSQIGIRRLGMPEWSAKLVWLKLSRCDAKYIYFGGYPAYMVHSLMYPVCVCALASERRTCLAAVEVVAPLRPSFSQVGLLKEIDAAGSASHGYGLGFDGWPAWVSLPSWSTVSFPSQSHCAITLPLWSVMPLQSTSTHWTQVGRSVHVSPLVPGPIPTINWPRGVTSGFCMAFLDALNPPGFTDSYDFFYLPMDTKNRTSLGQDWLKIGFSDSACFFHRVFCSFYARVCFAWYTSDWRWRIGATLRHQRGLCLHQLLDLTGHLETVRHTLIYHKLPTVDIRGIAGSLLVAYGSQTDIYLYSTYIYI